MKVLGVTLARGGSKGVVGKHTRDLCGKPVLEWTIEEARKVAGLTEYIVSSDDDDILNLAHACGAWTIVRPAELALDTTPTLPALQHAVAYWEKYHGQADYVVEIRATSPLKTATDIEEMIAVLVATHADSVIGVCRLEDAHPARIKQIVGGYLRDWPGTSEPVSGRRQDCLPPAFIRNGTVYAFRRDAVMGEHGRLFGHERSMGYIMPAERSVNIDTELDFRLCQLLMAERLERA